ncbi:MAG: hypothetical protein ABUL62_25300 [Myxococcales bacterium]
MRGRVACGLFFTDKKHPSSFATYLAGALYYAAVYGESSQGLALYPGVGDLSAPEISKDMARAHSMRATAAKFSTTQ